MNKPCGCKYENAFDCAEKRTLDRIPCSCECHRNKASNERSFAADMLEKAMDPRYSPECLGIHLRAGLEHLKTIVRSQGETAADPSRDRLLWLLGQLLGELPQKRDWLNPDVEREMRAAVKTSSEGPL
jgi:hypothetical protein